MSIPCPTEDMLRRLENGDLSDGLGANMERHLRECAICGGRMMRIRAEHVESAKARKKFRLAGRSGDSGREVQATGSTAVMEAEPPKTLEFRGRAEERIFDSRNARRAAESSVETAWNIPDYERVRLCGEGSYGSVWVVRDRVGVYRAMKLIDLARFGGGDRVNRERAALETYCRALHRHPYLVTVFHVGQVDQTLYYTMELADDCRSPGLVRDRLPDDYRPLTLDLLVRKGRFQFDVAMEIGRRLLRGLAKLHRVDLVHRDIKPSNVIFVNRQPKLADIGMIAAEPESGVIIGTPEFMPPDKKINKTADTYAMGKIIHQMICGPRDANYPELPSGREWNTSRWDLGRLTRWFRRAGAVDANDRFPDASVMLEEMEACSDLHVDWLLDEDARAGKSGADQATGESSALVDLFRKGNAGQRNGRSADVAETTKVMLACLRTVPWVLGFVVVMYAVSVLARALVSTP